jgi:hypothetical protein
MSLDKRRISLDTGIPRVQTTDRFPSNGPLFGAQSPFKGIGRPQGERPSWASFVGCRRVGVKVYGW